MDDRPTALLLVRHGQSTWNAQRRWQGQADPPLSNHGRIQAREAAGGLGAIDVIVSSPQVRAVETAVLISSFLGVGPVQVVEDLRERNVGLWSGLTTTEIEEGWPGWIDSSRRPDGWEPDEELLDRVLGALDAVVTENDGASLLVVSHGGVIMVVEDHLGVRDARIPNLHGRVVVSQGNGRLRPGERLELVAPELATGGTGGRPALDADTDTDADVGGAGDRV